MHQALIEEFTLRDQVAVITGAGSGIGQATACVFAQAGATLVLADVNEAGLAVTAAMVEAMGGEAVTSVTNAAVRAEMEALADVACRQRGRLDAWINAAGILTAFAILDAEEAQLDRLLTINLKGSTGVARRRGE